MQQWKERASTKIFLVLCLQLLLAGFNALFVFHQASLLEDDAEIINLAGVMRGSMQRDVKLALLHSERGEVEALVDGLLDDFLALRPGYELLGAQQEYFTSLEMLKDRWIILKVELNRLSPSPTPQEIERVRYFSEDVWRLANKVVDQAEEASQNKLARLRWGYVFAGLELACMLAVVWLVWSLVRSRLEPQALRDSLTGLSNRRVFDEMLPKLVAMAQRYATPLSLICFDLDHFKAVNDTLGHAAGDEVLRKVTRAVSGNTRSSDLFCRTGGEEFSLVCPHTGHDVAAKLAEKIRLAVSQGDMSPAKSITISLGVGYLRPSDDSLSLKERADALLYAAKNAGRDRAILDAACSSEFEAENPDTCPF